MGFNRGPGRRLVWSRPVGANAVGAGRCGVRRAPRALILAPRLPEYDRESGSRRVFNVVGLLLGLGWEVVLTVSEKEAEWINDLIGLPNLARAVPDWEALDRSPVPYRDRRGILFLGNFWHAPNRDAAAFLCRDIVPRLDPALLSEHQLLV